MPWELIGDCGTTDNGSWGRVQHELAIAYIKEVCGEPPKGCKVGILHEDSDYGVTRSVGLCWDRYEISDAPWDYIGNAELALSAFDDAIDWQRLDPEEVRERFPQPEQTEAEEGE